MSNQVSKQVSKCAWSSSARSTPYTAWQYSASSDLVRDRCRVGVGVRGRGRVRDRVRVRVRDRVRVRVRDRVRVRVRVREGDAHPVERV